MAEKRFPRDRGNRKQKATQSGSDPAKHRFVRHALYGDIPLVHQKEMGRDGKVYEWWLYDPDYKPSLPRGALPGEVRKQVYCPAHHVPKYFYVDKDYQCVQCGKRFTFRAKEQKYWYETLKFNFGSVPIRCLRCRRQRRTEHALRAQIAKAKAQVGGGDPAGYLSLARAIIEYHERTDQGKLDEAIAAARKAASLWPASAEPALWEGVAHARASRCTKAQRSLEAFLSQSKTGSGALKRKAEHYLQRLKAKSS